MRVINQTTEVAPLDAVRPHPKNPRSGDLGAIHESIQANGFYGTIIAQKSTGYILAGNHRHQAALQAGATEIPVTWVDVEDDHALRILLADNRLNDLATHDDVALAELLKSIHDDYGTLAGTGYDGDALDELLADLGQSDEPAPAPEAQVDKADELREKWGTELGQLWTAGPHRILCGDSSQEANLAQLVGSSTIDCVVTDPPYGIEANRMTLGTGKKQFARGGDWDKTKPKLRHLLGLASQVIIWGGNYFTDELPPTNDWLCWHKKNDGLTFSEFELAWTNLGKNCRLLAHHWSGEEKEHPTQKPLPVMQWCIGFTEGTVYDPFLGSGTTMVAAEQAGRACYGMEIDPAYAAVALERLSNMGLTPKLESEPKHNKL